jgi:hypothetical protein
MDITILIGKIKEAMHEWFPFKSEIPTKTSDLTNDLNFIMKNEVRNNLSSNDTQLPLSANQGRILDDIKVNKVTGKGLSTNDFTNADKAKLDAITVGTANLYISTDENPNPRGGYTVFKIGPMSVISEFVVYSGGRGALAPNNSLNIYTDDGGFPNELKTIVNTDYANIQFSDSNLSLSNTGLLKNNGSTPISDWHIHYNGGN